MKIFSAFVFENPMLMRQHTSKEINDLGPEKKAPQNLENVFGNDQIDFVGAIVFSGNN